MTRSPSLTVWDDRYAVPGYVYGTEPNSFLAEITQLLTLQSQVSSLHVCFRQHFSAQSQA